MLKKLDSNFYKDQTAGPRTTSDLPRKLKTSSFPSTNPWILSPPYTFLFSQVSDHHDGTFFHAICLSACSRGRKTTKTARKNFFFFRRLSRRVAAAACGGEEEEKRKETIANPYAFRSLSHQKYNNKLCEVGLSCWKNQRRAVMVRKFFF